MTLADRPARGAAHPGLDLYIALGLAFAFGFLILPASVNLWTTLPQTGTISVLVGLAGFASVIVCPGWWGMMANIAGLTAYITLDAMRVDFSGLHYLALALMLPPVAVGASCGTIVNCVRTEGLSRALADRMVWRAALSAIVFLAVCLWSTAALFGPGGPP